jgi:DNA-binding NarL/FixJ family response regulator
MNSGPIRVLVVDDHPLVRQGLNLLLAPEGFDVCADAERRDDALASVKERRPDLAIVDLSLDDEDGLVLVADLRRLGIPVLVYSMYSDARHVGAAFAAGALGYVSKRESPGVLVEGVHDVSVGRRFVSPKAAPALAESVQTRPAGGGLHRLSPQEARIYGLVGLGRGTAEIAAALDLSAHTVESYYARIREKLGLERMQELRHHAIGHFHENER